MSLSQVRRRGVFAPLSSTYFHDDAVIEVGEDAELLFVRGLAFCAGRKDDGYISESQLLRFVAVGMTDPLDRAKRLVEAGLWERSDLGYRVRSWLAWNPSAEELGYKREVDRLRKRAQADARADAQVEGMVSAEDSTGASATASDGTVGGFLEDSARNPGGIHEDSMPLCNVMECNATQSHTHSADEPLSGESDHLPGTNVGPTGEPPKPKRRRVVDDEHFKRFWETYPRPVDKGHARLAFARQVRAGVDPEAIIAAAAALRADPNRPTEKFLAYPATWLNGERWEDRPTAAPAQPERQGGSGGAWWDN